MRKELVVAVMSAIDVYLQQEEIIWTPYDAGDSSDTGNPAVSRWRLFGQQEQMRARANWRIRKNQ